MYVNDLVKYMRSGSTHGIFLSEDTGQLYALIFADDVSTFADTALNLQRHINIIEIFCNNSGLQLNTDKSKVMVFRNGGPLRNYERWYFNGIKLEAVSYYKYLGLYFTPKLSWSLTRTTLAKQAFKAVFCILNQQRYFSTFNPKDAFKLFDTVVRPILCYGAIILGYQYSAYIEEVHTNFCKRTCGLNQNVFPAPRM
jgi:hypothetical protein